MPDDLDDIRNDPAFIRADADVQALILELLAPAADDAKNEAAA